MPTIHFVTGNAGKARLLEACVGAVGFTAVQVELPLVEPQASTVEAVARAKATQAFAAIGGPLVVEDSGFGIDALAGFPGPATKYVLATVGAEGLLRLAAPLTSRVCRFVGALVHVDAQGVMRSFCDDAGVGTLADAHDPTPCPGAWSELWGIFIPDGATRPISAASPDQREALWSRWREHSVYMQLARWLASQ